MNGVEKVRFWYSWNQGYVRLTVHKGRPITLSQGGPTDEGHHWFGVRFSFDGTLLLEEGCSVGQDCDGPYRHGYSRQCPVDRVSVMPTDDAAISRPDWEIVDTHHRDAYAEAMGY